MGYVSKIWQLRYFWFSLVRNDLSNRYKRSFFGMGWSLLRPLAMTAIFTVVFGKLFNQEPADYVPYLLLGMTIWQFITECLMGGCGCFSAAAAYIRQQQVPLAIFPLRTVLGAGFHAMIALAMALTVVAYFRGLPAPGAILALLPGLLVLFVVGWFMAIVSGVIHTHFPDTHHLLEIGLQIMFYVTPIIYKPEFINSRGRLSLVVQWNPFTSLIALVRTPILDGTLPSWQHLQISLIFLGVMAALGIVLLRRLERSLVFWI